MFVSVIFFIIVAVICMFAVTYARARKVKGEHIKEAERRGDTEEVKRLKNMSDDEAADEFEDELL